MLNKVLLLVLAAAGLLAACAQQPAGQAPVGQSSAPLPAQAAGIWIDVRTPEEYAQGHLRDAVNIPVEQIADKIGEVAADKDTPVYVYCRSGRRSEAAAQQLRKLGYTQVSNQGAYQDLMAKGLK